MAAPIYLTPKYINIDMVTNELNRASIYLTNDETDTSAIYIPQVNDWLFQGECFIISTVLRDYVNDPLQSVNYNGPADGTDFDTMATGIYSTTYGTLKTLFIAGGLLHIFREYYSMGGSSNGADKIKQQAAKISLFNNNIRRIDRAGNLINKNIFAGLKTGNNTNKRTAHVGGVPNIPKGDDQEWGAFNAIPNYRSGFNR